MSLNFQLLKLCKSNSEAKKLIVQGAIKINDKSVTDKDFYISKDFFKHEKKEDFFYLVIYVGKKNYGIIKLVS